MIKQEKHPKFQRKTFVTVTYKWGCMVGDRCFTSFSMTHKTGLVCRVGTAHQKGLLPYDNRGE